MASTYPLEVVSAARWLKNNPGLSAEDRSKALAQEKWDPSVTSLVAFPQVLDMMNEKNRLDRAIAQRLFAQQNDLVNAVQSLRAKARAAGNLKSVPQQTVTEAAAAGSSDSASSEVIVIQPAEPDVAYLPSYDPTVVYEPCLIPTMRPCLVPTGLCDQQRHIFWSGPAMGGYFWGNCDWHNGQIDVDVNNYNNLINHFPGPHLCPIPEIPGMYPGITAGVCLTPTKMCNIKLWAANRLRPMSKPGNNFVAMPTSKEYNRPDSTPRNYRRSTAERSSS